MSLFYLFFLIFHSPQQFLPFLLLSPTCEHWSVAKCFKQTLIAGVFCLSERKKESRIVCWTACLSYGLSSGVSCDTSGPHKHRPVDQWPPIHRRLHLPTVQPHKNKKEALHTLKAPFVNLFFIYSH